MPLAERASASALDIVACSLLPLPLPFALFSHTTSLIVALDRDWRVVLRNNRSLGGAQRRISHGKSFTTFPFDRYLTLSLKLHYNSARRRGTSTSQPLRRASFSVRDSLLLKSYSARLTLLTRSDMTISCSLYRSTRTTTSTCMYPLFCPLMNVADYLRRLYPS
jgi:hypothetical protein